MRLSIVEHGTLWAAEPGARLPPLCHAQAAIEFKELGAADAPALAAAMGMATPELVLQRLRRQRRCFCLSVAGQIACYGWVTLGVESVGELEREFHLHDDEAYIWHCGTLPAWRGRRLYSALLSQIVHQLHAERVPRIWIGASRLNQASVRGIANAGFEHVVDITYRRLFRLTLMRFFQSPTPQRPLVAEAYRILLSRRERLLGRLAVGYK